MQYFHWFCLLVIVTTFPSAVRSETNDSSTAPETPSEDAQLSFEGIQNIIDLHSPKTITELIALLPKSYRSYFTLVHASRSNQGASLQFPRVIFYGPDATLAIAINGDPSQAGYHSLELIQYRPNERKWELRKIVQDSNGLDVSEENPSECLICHKNDPRPNWEPYSNWPGTFASRQDRLNFHTFRRTKGPQRIC